MAFSLEFRQKTNNSLKDIFEEIDKFLKSSI